MPCLPLQKSSSLFPLRFLCCCSPGVSHYHASVPHALGAQNDLPLSKSAQGSHPVPSFPDSPVSPLYSVQTSGTVPAPLTSPRGHWGKDHVSFRTWHSACHIGSIYLCHDTHGRVGAAFLRYMPLALVSLINATAFASLLANQHTVIL